MTVPAVDDFRSFGVNGEIPGRLDPRKTLSYGRWSMTVIDVRENYLKQSASDAATIMVSPCVLLGTPIIVVSPFVFLGTSIATTIEHIFSSVVSKKRQEKVNIPTSRISFI